MNHLLSDSGSVGTFNIVMELGFARECARAGIPGAFPVDDPVTDSKIENALYNGLQGKVVFPICVSIYIH